jgi:hypothetical protein
MTPARPFEMRKQRGNNNDVIECRELADWVASPDEMLSRNEPSIIEGAVAL